MTSIVVATNDYREDFEWHFKQHIDTVALLGYSLVEYKDFIMSISYPLIEEADLIVFTGGEDISPIIYGQENTHSYANPVRDNAEIAVLEYALQLNKKILGVCRGHQLINAYLGGTLVQDIESLLNRDHPNKHELVSLSKGGKVPEIFTKVNSIHHQGVTKVGESLKATSMYRGVVESCESPNIITTQFD